MASEKTGYGAGDPPAQKPGGADDKPTPAELAAAAGSLDGLETQDIDEAYIDFAHDEFQKLANEQKGARVLVLLAGRVEDPDDDGTTLVCFDQAAVIHGNKAALGSGDRFRTLEHALEHRGAHDPAALAAWIGRRKYGAKRFNQLSARARRHG